jgi:hypothetical protein
MNYEDPRSLYGIIFGNYDVAESFFSRRDINMMYPNHGNDTVSHIVLRDLLDSNHERIEVDNAIERLWDLGADFNIINNSYESPNDIINQIIMNRDIEDAFAAVEEEEEEAIQKMREVNHDEASEECQICLHNFETGNPYRFNTCACKNAVYHKNCLVNHYLMEKERREIVKCPSCRQNSFGKRPRIKKRKYNPKRRRSFGYTHSYAPETYGAHYSDGMLLADDAFSWSNNPLARALNSGS